MKRKLDKEKVREAFHEIKKNPPSTLKKQSPKRMQRQRIAIALSKARKRGAHIPDKKKR